MMASHSRKRGLDEKEGVFSSRAEAGCASLMMDGASKNAMSAVFSPSAAFPSSSLLLFHWTLS